MLDILSDDLAAPVTGLPNGANKGRPATLQDVRNEFGETQGEALTALGRPASTGGRVEAGAEAHEEVGPDPAEAAEEFVEATPEQLAASGAEAGEESAELDLKAEGYEGRLETAAEGQISEAGAALQGGQQAEFFGFLAALAPMLISSVGPALVKAVSRKLSPKTRRAVSIIAKRAPGPIGVGATKLSQVHGLSGLAPLIARLFESAAEGGEGFAGETGEESAGVNEALVSETAAAMEVIIGSDDRIRINNTTSVPWRRYCALRIYFPSGAQYRGTGFLIGPRALATAGHCVYMRN